MTRRLLAALCALAAVLPACSSTGGGAGDDGATTVATAADSRPAGLAGYDRFLEETQGNEPTAQQALDWFVSVSGAEVPGATAAYGDLTGKFSSFTREMEWLLQHWEAFTAEQRGALRDVFSPPTASGAVASPALRPASDPEWLRPMIEALAPTVSRLADTTIDLTQLDTSQILQHQLGTGLAATENAFDEWPGLRSRRCVLQYGPAFLAASRAEQRASVAHELAHCALYQHYGYVLPRHAAAWYAEGGPALIGELAVPESESRFGRWWWSWYFGGNARTGTGGWGYSFALDTVGYSAVGVFAWAAETRGSDEIAGGWIEHYADPSPEDWLFGEPGTARRAGSLSTYATKALRQPWGARWTMQGLNLANHGAAASGRYQNRVDVAPGSSLALSLGSGALIAAGAVRLVPAAGVDLLAVQAVGFGGITAAGRGEAVTSVSGVASQVFCIGRACECREPIEGVQVVSIDAGVSPVVALAADIGFGASVTVQAYDLPDDGSTCNPCPTAGAGPPRPSHAPGAVGDPLCGGSVPPVSVPDGETAGRDRCLVGNWVVNNPEMSAVFLRTVTTPGASGPPTDFVSSSVSGTWVLALGADGSMTMTAVDWALTGTVAGPPGLGVNADPMIDIRVTFNGTVTGRWTASAGRFSASEANGTLSAAATASFAGQTVDVTGPWMADLPLASNGASTYVCGGGSLSLTPSVANGMPLYFDRVN